LPRIPVRWGERRSSRRLYRAICDIPLDIAKEELDRRVRAVAPPPAGGRSHRSKSDGFSEATGQAAGLRADRLTGAMAVSGTDT
jgi:hypothetical protein